MKVTLEFDLDEEVTPELFAQKVAVACAKHGAIRENESVSCPDSGARKLLNGGRYYNCFRFLGFKTTYLSGASKAEINVPDIHVSLI